MASLSLDVMVVSVGTMENGMGPEKGRAIELGSVCTWTMLGLVSLCLMCWWALIGTLTCWTGTITGLGLLGTTTGALIDTELTGRVALGLACSSGWAFTVTVGLSGRVRSASVTCPPCPTAGSSLSHVRAGWGSPAAVCICSSSMLSPVSISAPALWWGGTGASSNESFWPFG